MPKLKFRADQFVVPRSEEIVNGPTDAQPFKSSWHDAPFWCAKVVGVRHFKPEVRVTSGVRVMTFPACGADPTPSEFDDAR